MMNWTGYKNLLVIRPDNMGDLLMSSPAIRALKETFQAKITLLTSALSAEAAELIPEIDDTIITSLPWVKSTRSVSGAELIKLAEYLRSRTFEACVIFTVYSQNPMPAAMLAWMAGIPKRLAYCRENPYELINCWVPDKEPYSYILHQVERDLKLVEHVNAFAQESSINLTIPQSVIESTNRKLQELAPLTDDFILIHAGVSELKRAYPTEKWIELSKVITQNFKLPVLFMGSENEKPLTDMLQQQTGSMSYSAGGLFNVPELAAVIKKSRLLISVNTGPVHIAAGLKTPVLVLYAQTNPQHKPWMTENKVLEFPVNTNAQSKNEVIAYVNRHYYAQPLPYPDTSEIIPSVHALLYENKVL